MRHLTLILAATLSALLSSPTLATSNDSLDQLLRPQRSTPSNPIPEMDKVNPFSAAEINNAAVKAARDGDVYTAEALLKRAQQLAPENRIIAANAQDLSRWLNGRIKAAKSSLPKETNWLDPEAPPALWPANRPR